MTTSRFDDHAANLARRLEGIIAGVTSPQAMLYYSRLWGAACLAHRLPDCPPALRGGVEEAIRYVRAYAVGEVPVGGMEEVRLRLRDLIPNDPMAPGVGIVLGALMLVTPDEVFQENPWRFRTCCSGDVFRQALWRGDPDPPSQMIAEDEWQLAELERLVHPAGLA